MRSAITIDQKRRKSHHLWAQEGCGRLIVVPKFIKKRRRVTFLVRQ